MRARLDALIWRLYDRGPRTAALLRRLGWVSTYAEVIPLDEWRREVGT